MKSVVEVHAMMRSDLCPGEPEISKCIYCGRKAARHFIVGIVGHQELLGFCAAHARDFVGAWASRRSIREISADDAAIWGVQNS